MGFSLFFFGSGFVGDVVRGILGFYSSGGERDVVFWRKIGELKVGGGRFFIDLV